jgi:Tfp pilus assembly protein PilN
LFATLLVVLLVVAGMIYGVYYQQQRVTAASDDVRAQNQVNESLSAEVAALAPMDDLRATYQDRVDKVHFALDRDVDWGLFLTELVRLVSSDIQIETFSGTAGGGDVEGAFGRVSFSGFGPDFPDVAEWLRTLESEDFGGVTGPWVSNIIRQTLGDEPVVNFTSTAILTPQSGTGRIDRIVPEVP